MHTAIDIRRGTESDAAQIAAFQQAMACETEGRTLDHETILAGVHGLLARPAHGFYLVAERDDQIAGSLMITPEWSDWRCGFFWWIQSVYIDASQRRAGVYRALYERVQVEALEDGSVIGVRLYVERENQAARTAYRHLGMVETPYRLYESPVVSSSP